MSFQHVGNVGSIHVVRHSHLRTPLTGISQELQDRHPYYPEKSIQNFQGTVHPFEVYQRLLFPRQIGTAYGDRCMSKYIDLFYVVGMSYPDRFRALSHFYDLLSSQEQKIDAINSGCIEACVLGLKNEWSEDPPTASRALDIVASCSLLEIGRQEMKRFDALEVIVPLMRHEHYRVRESASRAFHYTSKNKDGVSMILSSPTTLPILIPAIIDDTRGNKSLPPSNEIIYHSCSTLANLTSYSPGCIACLKYDICVPYLLRALRSKDYGVVFKNEEEEVASYCQVLSVLWNLSNEEIGKQIILDVDSLSVILGTLQSFVKYPQIQFMGTGSVMALTINVIGKRQLFQKGGCQILAQLAESGATHEIQRNSRVTITNVAENGEARALLCRLLAHVPSIFLEVFDLRSIPILTSLVTSEDSSLSENALHLLYLYARGDSSQENVVQALYVTENAVQFAESHSTLHDEVAFLLEVLVKSSLKAAETLQSALTSGKCSFLREQFPRVLEAMETTIRRTT